MERCGIGSGQGAFKAARRALYMVLCMVLMGCGAGGPPEKKPEKLARLSQALPVPFITAGTRVCSAAPGDNCSVKLEWNTGSTQTNSRVFYRQNAGAWTALVCVTGSTGSTVFSNMAVGTTYDFAVRAVPASCAGTTNLAQTTVRVSNSMLTSLKTELRYQGKAFRDIGMFKPDLFQQFLGIGDAPLAQGQDALTKAQAHGVKTMSVLAAPWWPSQLALWDNNPTSYWQAFDSMLAAAAAKGIKIVPVIWPNMFVFCDYVGRPLSDTFSQTPPAPPAMWSRALLLEYAQDFATRYANDTRIAYVTLAYQLNLRADTNFANAPGFSVDVSKGTPSSRGTQDNFTTDQMISLMSAIANTVRAADAIHLLSSGYGPPKQAAAGYRAQPEWNGGPAWSADSQPQMAAYLADTHADPIDIVSVELTNGPSFLEPFMPTNQLLGNTGTFNPDVMKAYQDVADAIGKPLAISMFWDSSPTVSDDARGNFARRVMLQQMERSVPISFINSWMSYLNLGGQVVPWASSLEPTPAASQMNDLIDSYQALATSYRTSSGPRPTRLTLTNPSFETGTGIPTGWTKPPSSSTAGQVDATSAFQGSKSARLNSGAGLESTPIAVKGFDQLVLSAALSYPVAATGTITLQIVELGWDSAPIGQPQSLTLSLADGGNYRVESLSVTLGADTYKVRARFQTSGIAVNVDDVRLTRLAATGEGCPLSGSFDTCSAQCPCKWGSGDCDADAECATGLVCATNKGSAFGLATGFDMCLPSHCTNGVKDAALGETGVNIGGPCGETLPTFAANAPKFGNAVFDGYGRSMAFAKQHSSLLFIAQPEAMLSPNDLSWPTPLLIFAGPTKTYAQYRKMLAQGTSLEQQWLAGLDDIRRRASRHPAFLYAELNSYRISSLGPAPHRITPPQPLGGAAFPARFKLSRRLLTDACCPTTNYAECNANAAVCTPAQSLETYQSVHTQEAVANLARFYVDHFEPQAFGPFAEMNFHPGLLGSIDALGNPSGDEWVNGMLPTYARVLQAVRSLYTERGLTPIPIFPSWAWDFMTSGSFPHAVTPEAGALLTQVYAAAPFDYIGISVYPAGWGTFLPGRFAANDFATLQSIGPAFFTSVYSQFSPQGVQLPLAIAETGWPGVVPGVANVPQNQRLYFEWLLGPSNSFQMVMSYFGVDPRYPDLTGNACSRLDIPLGLVSSAAYGIRPRTALNYIDSRLYSTSRDVDGDGDVDSADNCPYGPNANQADADADGVGDVCDNCKTIPNSDQFDGNIDGYGNACDADFTGDGAKTQADLDILNVRVADGPLGCSNPTYSTPELDLNGDGSVTSLDVTAYASRPSTLTNVSGYACAGQSPCPKVDCAAHPTDPCVP